jgi:hypothetical protein
MSNNLQILDEEERISQAKFLAKQDLQITVYLVNRSGIAVELPLGNSSAGKQIAQLAICYRERVLEELKKKKED